MSVIHCDLLTGLASDDAAAVLALGERLRLSANEVLFDIGDSADKLYLLRSGRIALTLPMQIGGRRQDAFTEERVPGQTLGWSALIPPWRFTLKASASVDSELVALSRTALLEHFVAHPHVGHVVGMNLAALIGQRLQVVQTMWLREMQQLVNVHV
jgi:CRP/FNR family cyclic AMP-dependent transcriptional regulator